AALARRLLRVLGGGAAPRRLLDPGDAGGHAPARADLLIVRHGQARRAAGDARAAGRQAHRERAARHRIGLPPLPVPPVAGRPAGGRGLLAAAATLALRNDVRLVVGELPPPQLPKLPSAVAAAHRRRPAGREYHDALESQVGARGGAALAPGAAV